MTGLGIGALIGGGINLARGLFGSVQAAKAQKQMNRLMKSMPTYKRPEEYAQELAMRQGLAAQNAPAWMGQAKTDIGGAFSQALGASERGAISSNTYQRSVGDLFSKQLQAYQELGMQAQQWQERQKENLMGTMQRGAGYSDTEWQENRLRPWEIRMNMANEQRQAGATNLWGGLEGLGNTAMNFLGTQYAQDVYKALMGTNGGDTGGRAGGNVSKPLGQPYSPQANLNNTLSGMRPKVNFPTPYGEDLYRNY